MNKVIESALEISTSVRDTIASSLAWSGASRYIASIGKNDPLAPQYLAMAGLAVRCQAKEIKPSVKDVMELLDAEPERETLNDITRKQLLEAGETEDSINAMIEEDFIQSQARHADQQLHLTADVRKQATETLAKVFVEGAPDVKEWDETLTNIMEAKVIEKVQARKRQLTLMVVRGRSNAFTAVELKKVNEFLTENAPVEKAA